MLRGIELNRPIFRIDIMLLLSFPEDLSVFYGCEIVKASFGEFACFLYFFCDRARNKLSSERRKKKQSWMLRS